MIDMEQFVQQITPLLILMILFPAAILVFYFTIVRPYLRKNKDASDKTKATPAAPSALDMLRQAQTEAVMEDVIASDPGRVQNSKLDTGDLPDLGMLLNSSTLKRDLPVVPSPSTASKRTPVRQMAETPQRLKLSTGDTTDAKEMLTVLRDENDGRLMVQIGETGYRSLLDSPEAKKMFTSLMKELSSSIMTPDERSVVADEAPSALPAPASSSLSALRGLSEVESAPKPNAADMRQPRRTAPPPPMADGTIPGALPSYKFDDNPANVVFRRDGTVKKVDFVPPPAVDIPSAIEAYLQYKIQYTPEYQEYGIHIRPGMGGGVSILVGGIAYDAVDEVENVNVRTFLKEAIAEWQERQ